MDDTQIDPKIRNLAQSVLDFWFQGDSGTDLAAIRKAWFQKDDAFDRTITEAFLPVYERAKTGELDNLNASAEGCLALAIILDQFPRNMFRNDPRAFATDAKALAIARHALDRGFDQQLPVAARMFLYMPFMHSEDLADQDTCCALFAAIGDDALNQYAVRHRDIIARFGRFPHRNTSLGRPTTDAETAFLQQPGSSF